jgi:SAM-dependent methyltransferase
MKIKNWLYNRIVITVFPLYEDNGYLEYHAKESQIQAIRVFKGKIDSKAYGLIKNNCICGVKRSNDLIFSERDRHGLSLKYVICRACGLVRLSEVLNNKSMSLFYRDDYNNIYKSGSVSIEAVFEKALPRAERYFNLIKKLTLLNKINSVFESGTCTGANLYPYFKADIKVQGCDYDEKYLQYGRSKGIDLYFGDIDNNITKIRTVDLVISSHVLEHVVDPVGYIFSLIDIVIPGGYLLIEAPGLSRLGNGCNKLVEDLVNAHVYYYHKDFLTCFFKRLKLEVVYSDDVCTFVIKKTVGWIPPDNIEFAIKGNINKEWYHRSIQILINKYFLEIIKYKSICKFLMKIRSYFYYRYSKLNG